MAQKQPSTTLCLACYLVAELLVLWGLPENAVEEVGGLAADGRSRSLGNMTRGSRYSFKG